MDAQERFAQLYPVTVVTHLNGYYVPLTIY